MAKIAAVLFGERAPSLDAGGVGGVGDRLRGGNLEMISAPFCRSASLSPLVISFIGSLTRSRSRNMSSCTVA
jgi:hypothetical protein